jgi:hypothetical protein
MRGNPMLGLSIARQSTWKHFDRDRFQGLLGRAFVFWTGIWKVVLFITFRGIFQFNFRPNYRHHQSRDQTGARVTSAAAEFDHSKLNTFVRGLKLDKHGSWLFEFLIRPDSATISPESTVA